MKNKLFPLLIMIIAFFLSDACTSSQNQIVEKPSSRSSKIESPKIYSQHEKDINLFLKEPKKFPSGYKVLLRMQDDETALKLYYRASCTYMYNSFSKCSPKSFEQMNLPFMQAVTSFIRGCEQTTFHIRKNLLEGRKLNHKLQYWIGAHVCALKAQGCSNYNKCFQNNANKYFSVLNE
ncbi:MAG: hypothetical protein PF689_06490 [Deltaproteobacteria bacterium]|jgi:hypothetical protein|nr:hypothetical protein [Deltaproteobacteria bacterium]